VKFIKRPWAVVICSRPELLTMVFWAQGQAVEIRAGLSFVMDFDRMHAAD
jgi:hypothetical protein